MQLVHPQAPYRNLPADDVFFAVDDMGTTHGVGYLIYQCQPNMYPDCPINLYFSLECQPPARYLLLGAVVARARQIRDYDPGVRVRVYTSVDPSDRESLDFYANNGFRTDECEQRVTIDIPEGDGRIPMSCSAVLTQLNTPEDQIAFVTRLQQNDLTYMTMDMLARLRSLPHFIALGLYRTTELAGEVLLAGYGESCELYAIYIAPAYRGQGLSRVLLHRAMAVMAAEGCQRVTSNLLTHSAPQRKLIAAFNGQVMGITAVYPGLYL